MSMSVTATMTSALPQRTTSRPPQPPPTGPLPALPIAKTRKPLPDIPDDASRPGSAASGIPTPGATTPKRAVTSSGLPTPKLNKANTTPAVPTLNTVSFANGQPNPATSSASSNSPPTSALPTPGKTLRKTTSVGAFPQPPKSRVNSLPPSPLSASASTTDVNGLQKTKRDPAKHRSTDSGKRVKARSSGYGLRSRASAGSALSYGASPSLLNGNVDGSTIAADSRLSLPSPPQSRDSSADGYGTEGTQFEEMIEDGDDRGRPKSQETITDGKRHSKDSKGNVIVSVRVRPDAGGGDAGNTEGEWMVDGRRSLISYKGREGGDYRYDNVFSPHDQNAQVYNSAAKRLVRRVMEGYHGTVFAYGMTGTGKTFSMQGTANSPGVIPLAITDIFSYIRENPNREFLLRVSYLEIYNEKIYDLLSQSTPGQVQEQDIKLREDAKRGVYATPLKEEIVQSPNQLLRVISRGDQARRTGSTQFNARSSRSHAVVQIVVESRGRTPSHGEYYQKEQRRTDRILPGGVLVSTLSLIDLAGSEKAADNKERRTEGAHINKSLLTLGTVIGRLSGEDEKEKEKETGDPSKSKDKDSDKSLKHLPYRDSKLTRLLQPALSGNSLVSILCTIQLSSAGTSAAATGLHTGETLNTLKFASRAKNNIVSHAKRNESHANAGDPNSRALLDRYRLEIQELRQQLDAQNKAKQEAEEQDEIEKDRKMEEELERQEQTRHEEQMLEMQLARTALKERISHLNRLILSSKSLGVNSGRFSSASVALNRASLASNNEFGRPVSVRSRDSVHSTQTEDVRASAATLEVPLPNSGGLSRTVSVGSATNGVLPSATISQLVEDDEDALEDDDGAGDESAIQEEGEATLAQQNRMLQTDIADKNRYIQTLEKRLLQARRTSHSRVSMGFAARNNAHASPISENSAGGNLEALLQEKDREIDELKSKLDDQTRMVQALRSAARKRDLLDNSHHRKSGASEDTARPATAHPPVSPGFALPGGRPGSRTESTRSQSQNNGAGNPRASLVNGGARGSGHVSNPSTASRSSSQGFVNFSKRPLSPMALLSPTDSISEHEDSSAPQPHAHPQAQAGAHAAGGGLSSKEKVLRRKSVDEMTLLLDQMIQDKVESGHVVRGERGSWRVKRDTVMSAGAAAANHAEEKGGEKEKVGVGLGLEMVEEGEVRS